MKLFVVFSLCFYTFGSNAYYTSQSFTHLECKDSNDLVPKDDDGKNRYILNILEVNKKFRADGKPCDSPVDDKPDPCDPYVIVKIDGKHVYRTKTHYNSGSFEPFNEQVQTGPISNSSIITLELWDNDVGHSHDDPMAEWSGNAQYFLRSTYLYNSGEMIKVDMDHDNSKKSNEIRLSFNIKAGEAWFDANSTTCDSPIDGNANLCDAYVTVKIDGKEVYRTKAQHDTDHPKFDEIFQTGWIDEYSFIEFEMWDSDVGDSPDDPMSTWSGYAQYFLTYDSFVGNVTDDEGIHRNSLIVSTKMEQRASGEIVQLLFNIADGQAKLDAYAGSCVACNSYVTVTIDGKEVYRTKTHNDTNYPVFNEVFQTDWISVDAIVEFNMRGVSKESTDKLLSTWSGYAGCYVDHLRLPAPYSSNSLIVSTRLLDRKHPQDIKLSFNVTDGQAWLRADSTPCDPTNDGRYNPCDSGVLIKIDGKTAHSTYTEWDTDHPIFNKIFETGWMSKDAVITFEMWDGHVTIDEREVGTWHFMDGWSGNVDYYLAHETLVGSATDGNHRNSLNVSTKLIEKPEGTQ